MTLELDQQQAKLYGALSAWARDRLSAGHDVPAPNTMAYLARVGHLSPEVLQDGLVAAWSGSLLWVLKQHHAGVEEPHRNLPLELQAPNRAGQGAPRPTQAPAPETPAASTETTQERDFRLLRDWHSRLTRERVPGAAELADQNLRQVANSPWRSREQIEQRFPPSISRFAGDIAEVLAGESQTRPSVADAAAEPHRDGVPLTFGSEPVPTLSVGASSQSGEGEHEVRAPQAHSISEEGFAPYEFQPGEEEPREVRVVKLNAGGYRAAWSAHPDGEGLYRLVSSDGTAPYSPDAARIVAVKQGETDASDELAHEHAVRYYQVWWNPGESEQDAKFNQPVLWAESALVEGVIEPELRQDEGRVIGQWRTRLGVSRVQVFRIPVSRARGGADPAFRILEDTPNLGGFVDTKATRGERYLYQVFAEAEVDGVTRLSPVWVKDLHVATVHEPIRDLSFHLDPGDGSPLFDLSWTAPPGGHVEVYRSEKPPEAGSNREPLPEGAMAQIGLVDNDRLAHPLESDGARVWMRQVPWPRNWTRAYFTAVVVNEGKVFVGNTVVGVWIPPVRDPKLIERVDQEVLTFDLPEGPTSVLVYLGPRGMPSEDAMHGQPREITRSDYDRLGGLTFQRGQLNPNGCSLHLVSADFDAGNRVLGAPVQLDYPGVLRLSYTAKLTRSLFGKPTVTVALSSEIPIERAPGFSLVFNERNFPLSISDGIQLGMVPASEESSEVHRVFVPSPLGQQPTERTTWRTDVEAWSADVASKEGFVRLFAALPNEALRHVALLDPPIVDLTIRPLFGRKRGE
ncbi:hypothetical protein [Pseudoclavibacter helvolus]|uniref:hypothetical protein n=1 Tax=Pseudoclavibacter helvolus TaxID=255205 RepID=UPI0037353D93